MINDVFYCPTKIIFGKDTEKQVGAEVAEYSKNILIVYGSDRIRKSGLFDAVAEALKKEGISYSELGGVKANPREDLVYAGIEICRKKGIDFILGIGGGSVIDSAKAIAYGVVYDGDFMDLYLGKATPTACLPIGSILTIPGAGSESSNGSVITDMRIGLKRSCDTDLARPVFAIMNPELTYSVPMYHTLCGAFDAIAHVMERYFTNTRNVDVTDRLGEAVMVSMIRAMKLVKDNPEDYDVRAEIMWGCKMAQDGIIGVGREQCWSSHLLQRDVGSISVDSSHGGGLAVIVPAWMKYVYKHDVARFAQWANRVMGVEVDTYDLEATALEGIERLRKFIAEIGLPTTLREMGVKNEADIMVVAEKAFPDGKGALGGFQPLGKQDFINILSSVF